jgi:effector-binding domain-containing protein
MEIVMKAEQKTACIRARTPVSGLAREMGAAYGEIMMHLGKQGIQPAGAPYALYHNMDMNDLDVEMGFPVASPFTAAGRMTPGTIPGGRTAVGMHKGPYDQIEGTYKALAAFMQEQKVVPLGPAFEVYLNDPQTTKPQDLLTEVNFPLRG